MNNHNHYKPYGLDFENEELKMENRFYVFQVKKMHLTGDQFGITGSTSIEILGTFSNREKAQCFIGEYLEKYPGVSEYVLYLSKTEVE